MRLNNFISQGTISWLVGAHSIIHSYYVVKAWKHLYGCYPAFWQLVCIFFHDIGYWGMNYADNKSNAGHAELGAKICGFLFGEKGRLLVLGHSAQAVKKHGISYSWLEAPDDYSWILASTTWMSWNMLVEPYLHDPEEWKLLVKRNWESGNTRMRDSTQLYLNYDQHQEGPSL